MATLGEAIRNLAKAQGVEVNAHATIGESVRAVAKAKGLPADGNLSEVINGIADNEEAGENNTAKAVGFFDALSQNAISDYLIENSQAIMDAFGVSKEDGVSAIGTAIYNKLQGGETVSVDMSDGGKLHVSGHFDEGGEDTWHIEVRYDVPENGTARCFDEGSPYTVKGGSVTLIADPAEITNTEEYDVALCVYGYQADIAGVTVVNGEDEFVLDVDGLTKPADWNNPCIIDPNGATWTISLHDFVYPPQDAEGTVSVDGEAVEWAEIYKEL